MGERHSQETSCRRECDGIARRSPGRNIALSRRERNFDKGKFTGRDAEPYHRGKTEATGADYAYRREMLIPTAASFIRY